MPELASRRRSRSSPTRSTSSCPIRLAAPNILVMLAQTSVGLAETYFVSKLGTDALAGVALVFRPLMLMQMMSDGGIGGGVSSAIARALGAAAGAPMPTRWRCMRW